MSSHTVTIATGLNTSFVVTGHQDADPTKSYLAMGVGCLEGTVIVSASLLVRHPSILDDMETWLATARRMLTQLRQTNAPGGSP